jgi:hypothetical protein
MIFSATGVAGWVLTRQLVDLATRLPDYKINIETKIRSFQLPSTGPFKRLSETVAKLKKDLHGPDAPTVSQATKRIPSHFQFRPCHVFSDQSTTLPSLKPFRIVPGRSAREAIPASIAKVRAFTHS